MAHYHLDLARSAAQTELARRLAALREEFSLPAGFPPEVLAEADQASANAVNRLPVHDRTDLPLLTIDPPGSTDLDQAVHVQRGSRGQRDGFTVHYAIADVPAFIAPGGALDAETLRRGQTVYLPDGRIPLHPEVISENTGSLLPGVDRGAYLWTFALDRTGAVTSTSVKRALVRSREQLTYQQAQRRIDSGGAPESTLALLKEVGLLRARLETDRGGASLRLPEQEITATDHGYEVLTAPPLDVEDWNAQVSLMTGIAAAHLMLDGGVGLLRTMPPADPAAESRFRARTRALGHPWPQDQPYGEYLRTLDITQPQELAIMHAATSLFRGAGYTAFDGDTPDVTDQSAIASPYAHATAPLRRLVDRFVLATCLALENGEEVPQSIRGLLPSLPAAMKDSSLVTSRATNAALDLVEAASLHGMEGQEFNAVVISAPSSEQAEKARRERRQPWGEIQVEQPPVLARYEGQAEAGQRIRAVLITANMATRTVLFRVAGQTPRPQPSEVLGGALAPEDQADPVD
ncbi:RNB domain-containing ribonuclease [Citricoccus sp. NPDC079358]|uniref:RNB domain-containing ribonuclease n=1 Tax=Citricoccus sp. NPDC079358 TaxID=3154653 RepID=UPI00344FD9D3